MGEAWLPTYIVAALLLRTAMPREVINKAGILLAGSGVTQRWQMEEMSLAELEGIIPQAQHLREYLATKYVIRKLQPEASSSNATQNIEQLA